MSDTPLADAPEQTEVGSYFVANYPPFSVWTPEAAATDGHAGARRPRRPRVPLGLYLHIPFCRKRCHFCYFRVYTDKNAREVEQYLDVLAREWELYRQTAGHCRAAARFRVFRRRHAVVPLDRAARVAGVTADGRAAAGSAAEEITFECEPGTLDRGEARSHPRAWASRA